MGGRGSGEACGLTNFLEKVWAEAVVTLGRDVSVPGPEALALLASGRVAMPLSEYLDHPDRHLERRTFHYGHLLGPALNQAALDDWHIAFSRTGVRPPQTTGFAGWKLGWLASIHQSGTFSV